MGSTKRPIRRCSPVNDEQQRQRDIGGGKAPLLGIAKGEKGGAVVEDGSVPIGGEGREWGIGRGGSWSMRGMKQEREEEGGEDGGTNEMEEKVRKGKAFHLLQQFAKIAGKGWPNGTEAEVRFRDGRAQFARL